MEDSSKRQKLRLHHRIRRVATRPLFTIPLATFMVLLLTVVVGIWVATGGKPTLRTNNANTVILTIAHQERTVPTTAKKVGDLLQKLNIKLNPGDVVEPSKDTEIIGDNFRINVYRAVPVTIVDNGNKIFTFSAATTPRSIVKQAGITVFPEDKLQLLPTDNFLTEGSIGERVVIQRSYPIQLNLYGKLVPSRTVAPTIADLLKEKNIKLQPGDSVYPTDNKLTAGMTVYILNKDTKVESVEEPIAMPVSEVEDNTLTFGVTTVRQQGQDGKKLVTYRVEGTQKTVIQETIIQAAVPKIIAKGTYFNISRDKTAVMAAAGIPQSSYVYTDFVISHESGWNPASVNAGGCAGLGQACPASKLAAACPSWRSDPVCQIKYFNGYAVGRYGGWGGAYNFWTSHHYW